MFVGPNYYNCSNLTDAQLDQEFQLFKANKMSYVDLRLVWAYFYPNGETVINQERLNNFRRIIARAKAAGLLVGLSFWSHYQDSAWSRPTWAGTASNMYLDPVIRAKWLEWVRAAVAYLDDECVAYYEGQNEPYCPAQYRAALESLLSDTVDAIRENAVRSHAQISIRFIAGWNPYTGYFTRALMAKLNFLSLTIYINPFAPDDFYDITTRATWIDVQNTIFLAMQDGKATFIVEFGKEVADATGTIADFSAAADETQRLYYEKYLNGRFIPMGIWAAMGWSWVGTAPTENTFNLCKGVGLPRPAFFQLALASDAPGPQCFFDTDCEKLHGPGWMCVNGVCVPPTQPTSYIQVRVESSSTASPIAEANVTLMNPQGNTLAQGTTGSLGILQFQDLFDGSYLIAVSASGFQPQAPKLVVVSGGFGLVLFSLEPVTPTGYLAVTVNDAGSNVPLSGAYVELTNLVGQGLATAVTGPTGLVVFTGLGDGDYYVNAALAGYLPREPEQARVTRGIGSATLLLIPTEIPPPAGFPWWIVGGLVAGAVVMLGSGKGGK